MLCVQVNLSGYENITVFLAPSVVSVLVISIDTGTLTWTHVNKQKYLHEVFY